ncbi:hypothetical protein D3C80_1992560 [compost metagenome]
MAGVTIIHRFTAITITTVMVSMAVVYGAVATGVADFTPVELRTYRIIDQDQTEETTVI